MGGEGNIHFLKAGTGRGPARLHAPEERSLATPTPPNFLTEMLFPREELSEAGFKPWRWDFDKRAE